MELLQTREAIKYIFSSKNPLRKVQRNSVKTFRVWEYRYKNNMLSEDVEETILKKLGYKQQEKKVIISAKWKLD